MGLDPRSASARELLEASLGRLYILDLDAPIADLNAVLGPLWQEANLLLAELFDDQSLQFYMFRQSSYGAAVAFVSHGMPDTDDRTKYRQLVALFRDNLEQALERLDGPLRASA